MHSAVVARLYYMLLLYRLILETGSSPPFVPFRCRAAHRLDWWSIFGPPKSHCTHPTDSAQLYTVYHQTRLQQQPDRLDPKALVDTERVFSRLPGGLPSVCAKIP